MKNAELQELTSLLFATRRLIKQQRTLGCVHPQGWLQMETLNYIGDHEGPTMHDLAAFLGITAPSASSLIGKLARAGFVRRAAGHDRRAVCLFVTPAGKKELARGRRASAGALQGVFSKLSPRDLSELIRILRNLTGEK